MARLPEWAERVADGRVTEGVRNAILGMGEAARETLLRIAVSPSYRGGSQEGRRRGPAEAIGLLAAMPYDDGTARRLVLSLVEGPGDDEAPEIAGALCSFGAPPLSQQVSQLIPHLVEGLGATDDARAGEWIAELLVHVGRGDERLLPALVAALPRFPGEAALALGRLGDPHAILPLRGAFAAHHPGGEPSGFHDLDAVSIATAIEILGGELSDAERRKRDESERRARRVVLKSLDRAREAVRAGGAELRALRDPGPNDPCPCGSGRKFKRCHEGDEAFRRAAEEAFPRDGDAG